MATPPMGQFMATSQPSGQPVQNVYRPTRGAPGGQSAQSSQGPTQGQTWQLQGQVQGQGQGQGQAFPNTQGASQLPPRAFMGSPGNIPLQMNGSAPLTGPGPQFVPGGGRPVMLPPHMMPTNMLQRFQPQSGQLPNQRDQPSTPQQGQVMPATHQSPASQRADGDALSRIQSHKSDMTGPGAALAADDGRNRRGSGIFSSIRNRVAGGPPQEHREPDDSLQPQGPGGDAASEASILTEDTGVQAQRNPMFSPKRVGTTPDNFSYSQSKDSVVAHGPSTPAGERMSPPPSQFAPPGRKLTGFLGIGSNPTPAQPLHPSRIDMSRASTSTNATEPLPPGSIGGPPKKRFSALKGVFNRSAHQGGPKPGTSFTVKMPVQHQQAPQGQPHNQLQGQPQGPSPLGPSPGPEPGPQPGHMNGQLMAGQERVPTGLRQPGHSLQPQPVAGTDNDRGRKAPGGILGFLKGRPDSKSRDTPGQPGMPASQMQVMQFPHGQGQFQGQYGMQVPIGPDGRPLPGANQPQFLQPGGPNAPGSLPLQGQMAGQPLKMPMAQPAGLPQGYQPGVPAAGQGPHTQAQQTQAQFPTQTRLDQRSTADPERAPSALSQAQNQLTPLQESAKPAEPTPASSAVGSPVSQKSQPVGQFPAEQSRLQNASPASSGQPAPAPQPGLGQIHTQTLAAQNSTPAHRPLLLDQKPVQPETGSAGDGPALYGQTPQGAQQIQRPVSVSSQPQPAPSSIPGAEIERARVDPASSQPGTGGNILNPENRLPSRQSFSAVSPGTELPPSRPGPGSSSQESTQGAGSIQRPPSQQSRQSDVRFAGSQQGGQVPPGQGYPGGQSPWVASQNGPLPNRQQYEPSAVRPNGVPMNAQPKEKQQSTISKLLNGNKPSGVPAHEKPEKEKGPKGFMSVFKRGAKHAETPSQAQMPHGQQPYGPTPAGMQRFPQTMQPQPTAGPLKQFQQPPGPQPNAMQQGSSPQQPLSGPQTPLQAQQQPKTYPPIGPQAAPPQQAPRQGRPPVEPQYDQVPIPRGYGYVHGEGRLVPAPAPLYVGPIQNAVPYGLQPGQTLPAGVPQQQWAQGGVPSTQAPLGGTPGPQMLSRQATGPQSGSVSQTASTPQSQTPAQAQPQSQAPPPTDSTIQEREQDAAVQPSAGEQLANQGAVPTVQQPQPAPAAAVARAPEISPQPSVTPAQDQVQPRPEPTRLASAHSQESNPTPPPQVQRSSPPQTHGPPSPQVPRVPIQPRGQTPAESDSLSSLPSQRPGRLPLMSPSPPSLNANAGLAAPPPDSSLSPQATPGRAVSPVPSVPGDANISRDSRAVSPEPPVQSPSSPSAHLTPTQQRVPEDNIYDATPRHSQFPNQQQQQKPAVNTIIISGPVEPKSAGPSHEATRPAPAPAAAATTTKPPVEDTTTNPTMPPLIQTHHIQPSSTPEMDSDTDMESPIIASATIATLQKSPSNSSPGGTSSPNSSSAAAAAKDNVAIFERAKRKAEAQREAERRLVLEEKIPVFPSEPDEPGRRREEEMVPQMSATSYPGQEWNPYGEGGFEEWE
ncbi:hypothetical protein MMYC01_210655 [Madurella mycetomatis]|uniref:Uncharacterized protein n=1 Tax=Madurella mycetomatis TaxID=100816 RepID=A0A175VP14_9PEZI|nr:hypothetical protein MMYC01_210655 [Madurella mycetomatis]